jgi:hypothetical protein
MSLREMKKKRTAKGRMKWKVQVGVSSKVAPVIKQRAMSMMGDPSDDDEEDDEEY